MKSLNLHEMSKGTVIRVLSVPEIPKMHKLPIRKLTDEPTGPFSSVGCGEKKCFICDMMAAAKFAEVQKKAEVKL